MNQLLVWLVGTALGFDMKRSSVVKAFFTGWAPVLPPITIHLSVLSFSSQDASLIALTK